MFKMASGEPTDLLSLLRERAGKDGHDLNKMSADDFITFGHEYLSKWTVSSVISSHENLGAQLSDGTEFMICPPKRKLRESIEQPGAISVTDDDFK